jgi:alkyldihydroxyacetonephosphate synthase
MTVDGRARSLWGWGFADRFPDRAARRSLAQQVGALLGARELEVREPVSPESLALPSPRALPTAELAAFSTSAILERARHCYGKGYRDLVRGFGGDYASAPDFVARPRNEAELDLLLAACAKNKWAAIPFGGGTSVVGGVEAALPPGFSGAVSIDLGAFSRVLEVDPVSRAARIQAGALGPALEAQLEPHGFSLRHFPQSFEHSTLGGWIATRAGGHFATLYTHIDDLVESVRIVTPRGVWQSLRVPGSGAGPSPDRLALGSEGIFGVITEAWVRVQPRPRFRAQASVHFPSFGGGVEAARAIAQAGLYPSNCRLLDPTEALLHRVAGDGSSVLLLAFESADHELSPWMSRALALAAECGGDCPKGPRFSDAESPPASESQAGDAWRAAFFDAPYLQSALVSLGVVCDTFETACTWDKFAALNAAVTDATSAALRRVCGGGIVSCRFTHVYPDGPAPYYTFIGAAKKGGELEQWAEVKRAASDALSANGATITHHHAVGRIHRPWYDRERPEPFALALKAAKAALDPAGVLNPGVLVDV